MYSKPLRILVSLLVVFCCCTVMASGNKLIGNINSPLNTDGFKPGIEMQFTKWYDCSVLYLHYTSSGLYQSSIASNKYHDLFDNNLISAPSNKNSNSQNLEWSNLTDKKFSRVPINYFSSKTICALTSKNKNNAAPFFRVQKNQVSNQLVKIKNRNLNFNSCSFNASTLSKSTGFKFTSNFKLVFHKKEINVDLLNTVSNVSVYSKNTNESKLNNYYRLHAEENGINVGHENLKISKSEDLKSETISINNKWSKNTQSDNTGFAIYKSKMSEPCFNMVSINSKTNLFSYFKIKEHADQKPFALMLEQNDEQNAMISGFGKHIIFIGK